MMRLAAFFTRHARLAAVAQVIHIHTFLSFVLRDSVCKALYMFLTAQSQQQTVRACLTELLQPGSHCACESHV